MGTQERGNTSLLFLIVFGRIMTMRQFALWFSKQKPRLLPHFHGHKKYMLRALVELTRWSRKDSKNFLKFFIPGCQCSLQIHISYLIAVGPRKLWGVLDHWKRDRVLGAAAAKINAFPSLNFPWFSLLPTLILYLIPLPLWYLFHPYMLQFSSCIGPPAICTGSLTTHSSGHDFTMLDSGARNLLS